MDMRLLLYVRVMLFCWLVNSFDAAGGPQTSGPVKNIYTTHTIRKTTRKIEENGRG